MSNKHDDSLIIRTWHEIAVTALQSRASDIHIEAGVEGTLIRADPRHVLFDIETLQLLRIA